MSTARQAGDLEASAALAVPSLPAGLEAPSPAPDTPGKKLEIRRKTAKNRFRGTPPPATFDLDGLPDSAFLTETETAAVLRRSKACLENWRKNPDHALKWRRVGSHLLYEVRTVRAFLNP